MRKRNVLRSEYWERWVEKMRGREKIGIEQIQFLIYLVILYVYVVIYFFLIFRFSDKWNISERNWI